MFERNVHVQVRRLLVVLAWLAIALASVVQGQSLNSEDTLSDRRVINRLLREQLLDRGRDHQPVDWANPATGHAGRIVVFPATVRDNLPCRPYEVTWTIGVRSSRIRGMPCRDSAGSWVGWDEIQVESFELPRTTAAASFDCRTAGRVDEQLICSDVRVAAIDAEMGRHYETLRNLTPLQDQAALAGEQAEWRRQRKQRCDIGDRLTVSGRDHWQQLVSCLAMDTTARGHTLNARVVEIENRIRALQRLIARVRQNLRRLAYVDGAESGGLDARLAAAIRDFETDEGLPVTGTPSALVVERSQAVIDRITRSTECAVAKGVVHTQRICGRIAPN